jgi:hypothetical protein
LIQKEPPKIDLSDDSIDIVKEQKKAIQNNLFITSRSGDMTAAENFAK